MPHSSANHRLPSVERGARPPLRVGVILAHHFTLSAFAVFIDHLRLAADEGDRSRPLHVQWSIMSSRAESVPASCGDRKSTRLNSSHSQISYAVFCLKKKKTKYKKNIQYIKLSQRCRETRSVSY